MGIRDILVRIRLRIRNMVKTVGIKVFLTILDWWLKDTDPEPYLWLKDPDANRGGPKKYGSYGSGFPTLATMIINITNKTHDKILQMKPMIKAYK